jgi:hypothetical protein
MLRGDEESFNLNQLWVVQGRLLTVPAHAQQNDLNRKAAALEQRQQNGSLISRPPYTAKVNATVPLREGVRQTITALQAAV